MRKVVKPQKICEHCGSVLKHEEEAFFCDYCKDKFTRDMDLTVSTFWKNGGQLATRNEFCSWTCAISWLNEFPYNKKEVQFVSLPYITGIIGDFEKDFNEFFKALRVGVKKG